MRKTISIFRNGFEAVTRDDIECFSLQAMQHADRLRVILAAVARIVPDDEAKQLAMMGKSIADELHNEIDCVRECAEKAGLVGELVPEASHG